MEIRYFGNNDQVAFDHEVNIFVAELSASFPQYMHQSYRLEEIICTFRCRTRVSVVIETEYVDKQHRDSYYIYFSQKYREIPRNCIRLAFFEGEISYTDLLQEEAESLTKRFIGIVVLRPLYLGTIGKTLIDPKKIVLSARLQTCHFQSNIGGILIQYSAFPFSSQDNETMTCAQTSLYNLIGYYGRKYPEYRVLMPNEILSHIERNYYQRVLPANGLLNEYMAKVLMETHLYPRLYHDIEHFKETLHIYVESGIPFILGLPGHAVNCIGCTPICRTPSAAQLEKAVKNEPYENLFLLSTSALTEQYIIMDDNCAPYRAVSLEDISTEYYNKIVQKLQPQNENYLTNENEGVKQLIKDQDSMIVPLYRRVYIDAPKARDVLFAEFLHDEIFLNSIREEYRDAEWGKCKDNPIVWRLYLTASSKYRNHKLKNMTRDANQDIMQTLATLYMHQAFPHFIWVVELGTLETLAKKTARVEILLDASSSPNSESRGILSVAYQNHVVFLPELKEKSIAALFTEEKQPPVSKNVRLSMM